MKFKSGGNEKKERNLAFFFVIVIVVARTASNTKGSARECAIIDTRTIATLAQRFFIARTASTRTPTSPCANVPPRIKYAYWVVAK